MVPLGLMRACDDLVRCAACLADEMGASVLGVACLDAKAVQLTSPAEQDVIRRLLEAAGERFEHLTRAVRERGGWRRCHCSLEAALEETSWAADLLVLNHPSLTTCALPTSALRRWVRDGGCSMLIRTPAKPYARLGCMAALCDGSPRNLRAVRAAMPLLLRCDRVILYSLGNVGAEIRKALLERGAKAVDMRHVPGHTSRLVAGTLLSSEADVIVSGGWPETLEGGLFRSMTDLLLESASKHLFLSG